MKNIILILPALLMALPVQAGQIATTTATVTVNGQAVAYNVSPKRTPGYYRLAYTAATKKVEALLYSSGSTSSVYTLYCADTYAEIVAYAAAQGLTGLPADPNAGH